jgi:hypothetical protein
VAAIGSLAIPGAIVTVLLLLTLPASAAVAQGGPTVAPFGGSWVQVTSLGVGNSSNGCAHGTRSQAPYFNRTTGSFGLSIGSTSRSCGGSAITFNGASVNTVGIINIPFTATSNGTFNVSLHLAVTLQVGWNIVYGHCVPSTTPGTPGCVQVVTYQAGVLVHLGDNTTGSLVGVNADPWEQTNFTQNSTLCSKGHCTSTIYGEPGTGHLLATFSLAIYLSAKLVRGDVYTEEVYVSGFAQSEAYATVAHLEGGNERMAVALSGTIRSISVT